MGSRTALPTALLAAFAVVALSACAAGPETEPEPTETSVEEPVETTAPEPTTEPEPELEFTMPVDCIDMLPEDRVAAFRGDGLELLGGPGGKYGTQYFADKTPEESVGGMTCVWGVDGVDLSTLLLSVAPIEGNRSSIVIDLVAQGLNESTQDEKTLFTVTGDESGRPAIVNELRFESWISVVTALGGQAQYDEAVAIAADIASAVYR